MAQPPLIVDTSTNARAVYTVDQTGAANGTPDNPVYIANGAGVFLDIGIDDGADVAEGSTASPAYTDATGAANGTLIGLNKGLFVSMKATGANARNVQGPLANLSTATTTNPFMQAGRYFTTLPTYTNGQLGEVQIDSRGKKRVNIGESNGFTARSVVILPSDGSGNVGVFGTCNFVYDGTTSVPSRGDANAVAMQPALTTSFWNYAAAAAGILNTTTAVTMKTAAGGVIRNYIEALQLDWEAFGAASEVVIRDGAGGTVLYRMKIGTGTAGSRVITFRPALKGTANTLLEIATLTASVTGALYVNAQGWTGV